MTLEVTNSNDGSSQIKPFSINENPNLNDLKRHLIFTFGSLKEASQRVALTKGRTSQILAGHKVPKTYSLIKRYAESWKIDPIVLTQIFDRAVLRDKQ